MVKPVRVFLSLTFVALLVGCQPVDSVNPLYTEKQVVFDPALLGKWVENDGDLEFFQSGENGYDVVFRDHSNPADQMALTGYLINLDGHRFLDLVQKKWASTPRTFQLRIEHGKNGSKVAQPLVWLDDGVYLQFAPGSGDPKSTPLQLEMKIAHWFFRVANDQNNLHLDYIDDDRLAKSLEQKSVQISHLLIAHAGKDEKSDDRELLLTAATPELQKFVLEHVNDDQVFSDSAKFHRSEKPASPQQ